MWLLSGVFTLVPGCIKSVWSKFYFLKIKLPMNILKMLVHSRMKIYSNLYRYLTVRKAQLVVCTQSKAMK